MRGTHSSLVGTSLSHPLRTRLHGAWGLGSMILLILALLAACGGEGTGEFAASDRVSRSEKGSAVLLDQSDAELGMGTPAEGGEEAAEPSAPRKLIQNASLHLEVESCEDARRAIEAELAEVGGYVSSAKVDHFEGRSSRAVLVLRIPTAELGASLEAVAALGTVLNESLATQDITDEYFDIGARLTNARKLETRLHELLAAEAKELKDMLEVERELARVRETIERFEGRIRLWDGQVAFSTLTVTLSTRELYVAVAPRTLGSQIVHTFGDSWHALAAFGRGLLLVVVAVLPWLVPFALFVWAFVCLVRRAGRRVVAKPEA